MKQYPRSVLFESGEERQVNLGASSAKDLKQIGKFFKKKPADYFHAIQLTYTGLEVPDDTEETILDQAVQSLTGDCQFLPLTVLANLNSIFAG